MLILLRHGQSTANAAHIVQGQGDYPLTPLGREQACEAGQSLRDTRFDHVYCRDLRRARQTMEIVLGENVHPTSVTLTPALDERRSGRIEGRTYTELRRTMPPRRYRLWDRDYFEAPPGGERMADLRERVLPFMHRHVYPRLRRLETVLVVRHAEVMQIIVGHLKQMDEDELMQWHPQNAIPYQFRGLPPEH